jgi:hypothetical protein
MDFFRFPEIKIRDVKKLMFINSDISVNFSKVSKSNQNRH